MCVALMALQPGSQDPNHDSRLQERGEQHCLPSRQCKQGVGMGTACHHPWSPWGATWMWGLDWKSWRVSPRPRRELPPGPLGPGWPVRASVW